MGLSFQITYFITILFFYVSVSSWQYGTAHQSVVIHNKVKVLLWFIMSQISKGSWYVKLVGTTDFLQLNVFCVLVRKHFGFSNPKEDKLKIYWLHDQQLSKPFFLTGFSFSFLVWKQSSIYLTCFEVLMPCTIKPLSNKSSLSFCQYSLWTDIFNVSQ